MGQEGSLQLTEGGLNCQERIYVSFQTGKSRRRYVWLESGHFSQKVLQEKEMVEK